MDGKISIIDTNSDNILEYGICGYKSMKRPGYPEKIEWLKNRFQQGLKIKTLYSEKDGAQGMIEYIPGEYCWRPVQASGYMFIHCIFVGFKRAYKGKGYGSLLLKECIKDAEKESMLGVAIVTRKGSFMVGKELLIKHGFEVVDKAPPDFELLVKKIDEKSPAPTFKGNWQEKQSKYGKGLTIIRADQCPYTVKNINEICETAEKEFNIKPTVITLKNHKEAQESPCPFGIFCIIYNGKLIAQHPISNTRFMNIFKRLNYK